MVRVGLASSYSRIAPAGTKTTMSLGARIKRRVHLRARSRCEYCLMNARLQGATFHVEHIVPRCKGGTSEPRNLALACPTCNFHKADQTHATDLSSDGETPLFHPRKHRWKEHFRWDGVKIQGISAVGRATVVLLVLNHPRRLRIRRAEITLGQFADGEENF